MATSGNGDEFSLVPQWLKSNNNHGVQSPGTGSHAAGQHRDAWHSRSSANIISTGTRPAAEPSLRPSSLSAAPAGVLNTSAYGNSNSSSNLSRGDRDRDRDRDRAGHAAWSHFHTSSRSGRAGPHPGRESAGGHSSPFDGDQTDRFQSLGSPFKHTGGNSSSTSSHHSSSLPSRHGLQRSVSDSGGASSSADAVHPGFGTPQQRDRSHAGSSSHRQLGAAGSGSYGYAAADDKLGWRDSSRDRQPHGPAGPHPGRGGNKPPPLTPTDFPSLTLANSMTGSSPRSNSSDRLGSPQPYAPSVAPYKQDFLMSRGSLGWTSKLAEVPGAAAAPAAAAGRGAKASRAESLVPEASAAAAVEAADAGNASSSSGGGSSAAAHEDKSGGGSSNASCSGDGGSEGGAAAEAGHSGAPANNLAAAGPSSGNDVAQSGSSHAPAATAAVAGTGTGSSAAPGGASLADTLKQAVAASNAASNGSTAAAAAAARLEAQRRQSKALVPLLPGSKTKHGGKGEGRGGAMRRITPALATAAGSAAAAAGSNSSNAASKLLSPSSPVPLLKLGLQPHAGVWRDADALGGPAAAAGASGVLSPVSPSAAAGAQSAQAGGEWAQKAAGVAALTGAPSVGSQQQHQQQLSDRHSFFAVLKRKSSASHHTGNGNGSSGGGSADGTSTGKAVNGEAAAAGAAAAAASCKLDSCSSEAEQNSCRSGGIDTDAGTSTERQQHQQQSIAGPSSYSLADVPDTISSSDGGSSDGGCDRCSLTSDYGAQQEEQTAAGDADSAAPSAQRQRGAAAALVANSAAVGAATAAVGQTDSSSVGHLDSSSGDSGAWDAMEKEEEAFLRSLGWTSSDDEGDEDTWGLTQDEIAAFQAASAAHSALQLQHQRSQGQAQAHQIAGKLALAPGSVPDAGNGLFGGLRAGQVVRGGAGYGMAGVDGVEWPLRQSLLTGVAGQVAGWVPYWPSTVAGARIFGGDSSGGEETDSDGAD